MNKRGFSLVELLAVIAILGIMSGVAIGAATSYLDKAKKDAYDSIFTAASRGCETYILENNLETTMYDCETKSVSLEKLVEEGYMTPAIDPNTKTRCSGEVQFMSKKGATKEAVDSVLYRVDLDCPGYDGTLEKTFPTGENFSC